MKKLYKLYLVKVSSEVLIYVNVDNEEEIQEMIEEDVDQDLMDIMHTRKIDYKEIKNLEDVPLQFDHNQIPFGYISFSEDEDTTPTISDFFEKRGKL